MLTTYIFYVINFYASENTIGVISGQDLGFYAGYFAIMKTKGFLNKREQIWCYKSKLNFNKCTVMISTWFCIKNHFWKSQNIFLHLVIQEITVKK